MSPRAGSGSKFSVLALVTDHYSTLRSARTGKFSVADLVVFVGVPLTCAVAAALAGVRAQNLPEVLAAVAILTGLIFNVFVLLFDLTMRAADRTDPARVREVLGLATELRANISYAVLVGLTLTAIIGGFVLLSDSTELALVPSVIVVFGAAQMLLTILMVLKRVRALYRAFLSSQGDRVP